MDAIILVLYTAFCILSITTLILVCRILKHYEDSDRLYEDIQDLICELQQIERTQEHRIDEYAIYMRDAETPKEYHAARNKQVEYIGGHDMAHTIRLKLQETLEPYKETR